MVTEQTNQPKMRTEDVSVFYGDKKAVDGVTIEIPREFVTAFIAENNRLGAAIIEQYLV